tara:strand:+ start:180 stop:317 length:138 start_codon:yes stop_codon:yes gene_type:complete
MVGLDKTKKEKDKIGRKKKDSGEEVDRIGEEEKGMKKKENRELQK